MKLFSFIEFVNKYYNSNITNIYEGGSYGHMSHPYEDFSLTFGQIRDIVVSALQGKLNKEVETTEKLDGQAIAVSWKDGKLIASRNKSDRLHGGAYALDVQSVINKFSGRGDLSDGFTFAVQDLEEAISKIPEKERDSIFKNGYAFMHLEIIYPPSTNVINYNVPYLVFHNLITYNEDGDPISEDKEAVNKLQNLIKSVNADIQKHFTIRSSVIINMPKVVDFEEKRQKYLNIITKIQKKHNLNDSNTIGDYIYAEWKEYIIKQAKLTDARIEDIERVIDQLINRWAFDDNTYTIRNMKKDFVHFPKFLNWAEKFSKKEYIKVGKELLRPIEELFLSLGVEVLKNATGFLAVNPDLVVQDIKNKLEDIKDKIEKGGDPDLLDKLKYQLSRLEAIGGFEAIIPSEGIVFQYNGKTYKLTGAFASVNQILGLLKYSIR